ncbi:nucleotidyl transferase AbiEii/AbiGii toxin family protein [Modicisalibacter xianhensis]|uniref:nucleotidyl transferase AbiEii/AbiGii toxin family protein n=1 Tax=Modicisalibacter xianhensis TaxID=442341 RepID=UPI001AB057B5
MDHEGLLDSLTFQGGTFLRLCQSSLRFSEDLDFAGDWDFRSEEVAGDGYVPHRVAEPAQN